MPDDELALLTRTGELLFGPAWQSPMARELGANLRTVQRWAAGDRRPGPEQWAALAEIIRNRRGHLASVLEEIAGRQAKPGDRRF
jgi:hypothetical protein